MKKSNFVKCKKNGCMALAIVSGVVALVLLIVSFCAILNNVTTGKSFLLSFDRCKTAEEEGYDEDSTKCTVEYVATYENKEYFYSITYPYEEWSHLEDNHQVNGYVYLAEDGTYCVFATNTYTEAELSKNLLRSRVLNESNLLNAIMSLVLVCIGAFLMFAFDKLFSTYETIWFLSVLVLAAIFAILFPEEDCNGINGLLIMGLYLADTFLNILCELLISKQSKWNFLVSVGVEIVEILICVVLAYRFATMATTLFFWLPCDIISFVNWNKHPDEKEEEITKVRKLSGLGEVLVILGIVVWTCGIGYLLTCIDIGTDLFGGNIVLETIVCYLDACASAVGIANGLFILFRFREQWIAWYIEALLESVINVLSGQMVLLVLKAGYFSNTTYGYIQWTKYIKSRENDVQKE